MRTVASIVLFKHKKEDVIQLIDELDRAQAIKKTYLIDNGHCEWAKLLTSKKIKYIKPEKNIGYGAGHNITINNESSKSDFILILNPDIELPEKSLDKFILAASNFDADLFMPDIFYPDGKRQHLCKLLPSPFDLIRRRFFRLKDTAFTERFELHDADYTSCFFVPYLSGCFMLIRSAPLITIKGFDERYFMYLEDTDLSRQLARNGRSMFFPSMKVVHHYQKSSYKNFLMLTIHIKSAIKYFNKWGWFVDNDRDELNNLCLSCLPKKKAHH